MARDGLTSKFQQLHPKPKTERQWLAIIKADQDRQLEVALKELANSAEINGAIDTAGDGATEPRGRSGQQRDNGRG